MFNFNQTSLQHLLWNRLNVEYFTGDKLKNVFKMYICGLPRMNKLENCRLCWYQNDADQSELKEVDTFDDEELDPNDATPAQLMARDCRLG